jgi:AcrR family transcriptional regulator
VCLLLDKLPQGVSKSERNAEVTRKKDRRVLRTEQLLRAAMLALIEEKGFEALSVQEIADRANVGRATFYAHFDNKEDLLASGFDGLRATLKECQRKALTGKGRAEERVFAFSHEVFAHASEYRDVFQVMAGKESGAVVQQLLHKILLDLIRDEVKAVAWRANADSVPVEALARFMAGALLGVLMWWLTAKTRLAVEDINRIFRRLAIPTLKASIADS